MRKTQELLVDWAVPLAAISFTVFFAFYHLSDSPAVWYDEGFFVQAAMNLASHGLQVMQLSPGQYLSSWSISGGYPLIAPIAVVFKWLGVSIWNARAVVACYLILFVVVSYLYARRELGRVPALFALLLLATFPLLYGNGKAVLAEVPALFYLALTLLSLDRLRETGYKSEIALTLAAFCAALTFAAKFTFMFIAPALLIALWLRRKELRALPQFSWLAALVAFLVPIIIWIHFQFGPSDTLAEVLGFVSNPYENQGASAISLVFSNLLRFFTEVTPIYAFIVFGAWIVAIYLRAKDSIRITLAEMTAFIFSLCIMLAYLWSPGWYKYFFSATCVSLIFFPYACLIIWKHLTHHLSFFLKVRWLPYIGFVLLILLQAYQLDHHSYVADYYHSNRTEVLEAYFSKLDPNKTVFLYNIPEVGVFLSNPENLYQFITPHPDQRFGAENLLLLSQNAFDVVVVDAATYTQNPAPFGSYKITDHVAHYDVLTKP